MANPQNQYTLDVDSVGACTFVRGDMRSQTRLLAEYNRITEGQVTPDGALEYLANMLAVMRVFLVDAPFDPEELDPYDDDSYAKLQAVYNAWDTRRRSFRPRRQEQREEAGAGHDRDGGVVVPPALPPAAD